MVLDELMKEFEQLVQANQLASALAACDRALSGKLPKIGRARVLQWKARILVTDRGYWNGPAVECLKTALSLTAGNTDERGRVLNNFAAAYAAIGSVTDCRGCRQAFLELYRQFKSPLLDRFYPSVEFNYGLACHHTELLAAAEEAYLDAMTAYINLGDPTVLPLVHGIKLNLIDIYQETEQHEHAYRLLQEVEKALPDAAIGALVRLRRANYALHEGDLAAAFLQTESGLGHSSCDARTRGGLLLTKAKILRARGETHEALNYAMEALEVAASIGSSHLCHRISRFIRLDARGE